MAHSRELVKLEKKHDIWRIDLRNDPPEIKLKEGAKPFRCKARKYSPAQSKFMRDFNNKLVELGWVYRNQQSRWAFPARPVRKPDTDEFRQASDLMPVNAGTEPIAGVMPNLESKLHHARKKTLRTL